MHIIHQCGPAICHVKPLAHPLTDLEYLRPVMKPRSNLILLHRPPALAPPASCDCRLLLVLSLDTCIIQHLHYTTPELYNTCIIQHLTNTTLESFNTGIIQHWIHTTPESFNTGLIQHLNHSTLTHITPVSYNT